MITNFILGLKQGDVKFTLLNENKLETFWNDNMPRYSISFFHFEIL